MEPFMQLDDNDGRVRVQLPADLPYNQKWDVLKPVIKQLYLDQNRKLNDVMEMVKAEYGFVATEYQYKYHIASKWKLNKNISTPKANAYSTPPTPSDTSFRRTWDRTEYAAKAAARETSSKRESAARYEARLLGKKYHPPPPSSTTSSSHAPLPPDGPSHAHSTDTTSRTSRLDVSSLIGKTTLVPLGAAVGKRGKGAGFYCEACDLTFKDNVQFVDHLNSRQHLVATGQSGEVRRAGVEEVRERLRWLVARRREEEEERGREGVGLKERLEGRREEMEREREERRVRRREKRRMVRSGVKEEGGRGGVRGGIIC